MEKYKVVILEDVDFEDISFYCFADDEEHAKEQALEAYPNGKILSVEKVRSTRVVTNINDKLIDYIEEYIREEVVNIDSCEEVIESIGYYIKCAIEEYNKENN